MRKVPAGFRFVKTVGGISEYTLVKNGLRVLVMEDHSAPVATVMVTYHVGSRNEGLGVTGATHLLEHLMFKGSKNFHKKSTKNIWTLENVGADVNATTWFDRTNYFEVVPIEHFEDAVEMEADRMRHALIEKEALASEMTVVRNEFERGENEPSQALTKELWATAFQAHPYHHDTIGWRSDIENVSTERLREFYNTFYWPNNATVSIIGDTTTAKALALIKKHFGKHRSSPHQIPEMYTVEPPQEGERRVTLNRSGNIPIVAIAFKSVAAGNPDLYPLLVLASLCAEGKSSRLYRALVDRGLVSRVSSFMFPMRDPGLLIFYAWLVPGTKPPQVEKAILSELKKIKERGITDGELARVKKIVHADIAFTRDGSYALAAALNEAIAAGDWTLFIDLPKRLENVTREDVRRVARVYLEESQSTIGYFLPKK